MINKRAFVIGLAMLMSASALSLHAQKLSYKGTIDVTPVRFEQLADTLYVDLDIKLSKVRVKSELSIGLTPWLTSVSHESNLPVISIKGRSSYKAYKRSLAMERQEETALTDIVLKGFGKNDTVINYKYASLYEPWMGNASLNLTREDTGCCQTSIMELTQLVENVKLEEIVPLEEIHFVPKLAFVSPEAEGIKSREISAECRLDFVVNKTDINPSYRNNPQELATIRSIIDELREDPSISIVGLEIVGYASPEGSLANNKRLSEGRAMALRNYLASQYDFPMGAYKVSFGGENWDGLVKVLETEPMDYADEVLAVIENTMPDQTRKNKLKSLRGGAPYRYMLNNIYPGLRTAICNIDYHIKGFDAQDAVEVYKTHPQNLSLNELYMVAGTMEEGSPEFIEVFETAVRMYPNDETANLNAAIAAIQDEDIARAERYLKKVSNKKNLQEYNNAMGALSLLKKDFEAAKAYFEKANEGLSAARQNLEMLP